MCTNLKIFFVSPFVISGLRETGSPPRDGGNLMSIKRFLKRFDVFRLILLCITNAGSVTFAPQDTQECAWCSIGCGGRAPAAAAAAFGSTTSFFLSFLKLYYMRMYLVCNKDTVAVATTSNS